MIMTITRRDTDIDPPSRATPRSAGLDLRAYQATTIQPGERRAIPTGLRIALPPNTVGLIQPRSGLALRDGLDTLAGVIDEDYRGEIKVLMINHGHACVRIARGERIAQLLVKPVHYPKILVATELPPVEGERGEGGFGSTGRY